MNVVRIIIIGGSFSNFNIKSMLFSPVFDCTTNFIIKLYVKCLIQIISVV